jgi:glycerophosphoryl diester phosphodiesterase
MPHPLLLGHRGARATKTIPENTIASFDLALKHGCDGFEFDVRITADGECLVSHDPVIEGRTVAEAKRMDFPALPTLEDVLVRYADTAYLDIELKVPGAERRAVDLVRQHRPQKGFVLSSFLPGVLTEVHRFEPNFQIGLICETRNQTALWKTLPLTHIIPHSKLMAPQLVDEWHAEGKIVCVWTVNTAQKMHELQSLGIEAVISDETELLVKTLRVNRLPRRG